MAKSQRPVVMDKLSSSALAFLGDVVDACTNIQQVA